jgi:hypothetical protein
MNEITEHADATAVVDIDLSGLEKEQALPSHLIALPGGEWAVWRCVGLRGAGFPAAEILKLSSPTVSSSADSLLETEAVTRSLRSRAIDALDLEQVSAEGDRVETIKKTKRRLLKDKAPAPLDDESDAALLVHEYIQAREQLDAARTSFRVVFEEEAIRLSEAIQEIARGERFQEALTWQNRKLLHAAIHPLLRKSPRREGRNAGYRLHEKLVASYLQRYCVKNDTIGFFGPVGWADITSQGEAITVHPGHQLLASRKVFLESWCVDLIAKRLSKDQTLYPWMAPRLIPVNRVDGDVLHVPFKKNIQLSPVQAAILRLCDGERTAEEIAIDLIYDSGIEINSEVEVFNFLAELRDKGLITWAFEVPLKPNSERELRKLIDRIMDDRARKTALKMLAELEAGRAAIAEAAGNAEKLDAAMERLDVTFQRLSGANSTRSAGMNYAGRTTVYEDTRRDIDLTIGPELLDKLGPPLSLLLTSGRWFTSELTAIYRSAFETIYEELAEETGSRTVDATMFWLRAEPLLLGAQARPADNVLPLFQQRWGEVLDIPEGSRRVSYQTEELRGRVQAAFAAPGPGWKYAVYNSPDVMIAASSVDAIKQGDFQFVLGEFHLGTNTLAATLFVEQHPRPEDLIKWVDIDLPEPGIRPISPKSWPRLTTRTQHGLVTQKDFTLEYAQDSSLYPRSQPLAISQLVVEDLGNGLIARTRDGEHSFDVVEMFDTVFSYLTINHFRILHPAAHTPRVTIDDLVVCREAWRFLPSEISFAFVKDEAERFVAARRWVREQGMPRFTFVKVPVELKPLFLDFESPTYVDIFAKYVRLSEERGFAQQSITISEMLPAIDQAWLPDAEGNLYTSEFRIISVDRGSRASSDAL